MLKQRIIFEGTVGDDINSAIPLVINKAKEINDDVFLTWNGVTMRIAPDSTMREVLDDYNRGLHRLSLEVQENNGELIKKKVLSDKLASYITNIVNS